MPELRLQTKNFHLEWVGRCIFKGENVCQSTSLSTAALSCIPAERPGAHAVVRYPSGWHHRQPSCCYSSRVFTDPRPQSHGCSASRVPPGTHPTLLSHCQSRGSAKHIDKPLSRAGGLTLDYGVEISNQHLSNIKIPT